MSFDYARAIRELLDATSETDPDVIAESVAKAVPVRERVAVIALLLRAEVRHQMAQLRASNPLLAGVPAKSGARRRHNPSAKVRAVRDWHAEYLRDRIHIGDGQYRALGECSYGDLVFAARERRQQALADLAAAQRFDDLADLLKHYGVDQVADLPPEAFGRAA